MLLPKKIIVTNGSLAGMISKYLIMLDYDQHYLSLPHQKEQILDSIVILYVLSTCIEAAGFSRI